MLLTDLPLVDPADRREPVRERCGSCRACLDACPTGAITEPWFVDARRCLSYWTIEHRGELPAEDHAALGDWLFGCDACQEVCPWNGRAQPAAPAEFTVDARLAGLTLAELLRSDERRLREALRGTPLTRPKRAGLLRNALIVAANVGDADALREADRLAEDDPDPVVRRTARAVRERA